MVFSRQELEPMSFKDVRILAKQYGWNVKTGKKAELITYLLNRTTAAAPTTTTTPGGGEQQRRQYTRRTTIHKLSLDELRALNSFDKVYNAFHTSKTIDHHDVRKIATMIFGYKDGRKGNVEVLLNFIKTRTPSEAERGESKGEEETRTKITATTTTPTSWPIVLDGLAGLNVNELKMILKKHGIDIGLPRKREELLAMFTKKRCDTTDLPLNCSDDEICDLRNELCRVQKPGDLSTTRPHGIVEFEFQGKRFWGTKEMLNELKSTLATIGTNRETSRRASVVQTTTTSSSSSQEQESRHRTTTSPVRPSRLFRGPFEEMEDFYKSSLVESPRLSDEERHEAILKMFRLIDPSL